MLAVGPVWPENAVRSFPVCASHKSTSRLPAVATRVPSGLNATPMTSSGSVEIFLVARSLIGVRFVHPGLVTRVPSGLKAGV